MAHHARHLPYHCEDIRMSFANRTIKRPITVFFFFHDNNLHLAIISDYLPLNCDSTQTPTKFPVRIPGRQPRQKVGGSGFLPIYNGLSLFVFV